jgi:ArsR family transcriptional regulator, zinc-responsive transcriptional repressor
MIRENISNVLDLYGKFLIHIRNSLIVDLDRIQIYRSGKMRGLKVMDQVEKFVMMDEEVLSRASDCLKVLAHPVRLNIVQHLLNREYAVGELAAAIRIRQHVASEHLGLMKKCGFLSSRRDGQKVYYEVSEEHLLSLMECLKRKFG